MALFYRVLMVIIFLFLATRRVIAHGNGASPDDVWTHWNFAPLLLVGLALSVYLYLRGAATYRVEKRRTAIFLAGIAVLFIALISPLDAMGASLFSAHMGQHLLLVLVAAPLLVWSKPLAPLLRGMQPRWRKAIGVAIQARPMKKLWQWFVTPAIATTLHIITLAIWHQPTLYGAALANTNIHILEHASFLITALLFWWAICYSEQYGGRILSAFSVMMASGLLGALITFAPIPWYSGHALSVVAWHLTPLEDQQLAGLLMWIPMGTIYIVAAALLLSAWLTSVEHRSLEREQRLLENAHDQERLSDGAISGLRPDHP